MNLVEELGTSYFLDRFNHSMFLDPEGRPAYINHGIPTARGTIPVASIEGPVTKPSVIEGSLPYDFFKDLSVFAVPPMGFRSANNGRYLVHYSRNNRSYRRGVSTDNINRWVAPSSMYLMNEGALSYDYYDRPTSTIMMIMKPEFTPLKEGIAKMKAGELFSFAASSNLAVIPAVDDAFALYFNTNRVGTISADGSLSCTVPMVSNMIKEQL